MRNLYMSLAILGALAAQAVIAPSALAQPSRQVQVNIGTYGNPNWQLSTGTDGSGPQSGGNLTEGIDVDTDIEYFLWFGGPTMTGRWYRINKPECPPNTRARLQYYVDNEKPLELGIVGGKLKSLKKPRT